LQQDIHVENTGRKLKAKTALYRKLEKFTARATGGQIRIRSLKLYPLKQDFTVVQCNIAML